jgi:DNA-binding GntR family transcriptional regulator
MAPIFGKAVSKTLRTEVLEMLRDAIVSGKLEPGEHLKENEIAEQMSVSRSPVREAFRQLEQEGLIVSIPNQGCYVKSFSAKEIEEIFTLRATLENLACELVIQGEKLTPADYGHLETYVERQRDAIGAQAFDLLTRLDMDFHEFICRKSESERLLKMWQSLRGQIQVLFYQRFRALERVPETVDSDHEDILASLRNGDIQEIQLLNKEINARVARECIAVVHGGDDQIP